MIEVENLTKRYGEMSAIQDVSFSVGRGEVLGFLGPNGAGKTTTMRILCGCIGATGGQARLDGKDVLQHPLMVKRRTGYLPEVPPLYPNMVVEDYVRFAAQIKGVTDATAAATEAMALVGLSDQSHRLVGHLSKGYQQRVGLAQALVHKPDVLVLDEPTSGLDPEQRKQIRDLLQELAEGDRTVIVSTHVLPEVEAICKRVVIIVKGQVVATDSIEELAAATLRSRITLARPGPKATEALLGLDGVTGVDGDPSTGVYRIQTERDIREDLARTAVPFGLLSLEADQRLEDVYLQLTSGRSA